MQGRETRNQQRHGGDDRGSIRDFSAGREILESDNRENNEGGAKRLIARRWASEGGQAA